VDDVPLKDRIYLEEDGVFVTFGFEELIDATDARALSDAATWCCLDRCVAQSTHSVGDEYSGLVGARHDTGVERIYLRNSLNGGTDGSGMGCLPRRIAPFDLAAWKLRGIWNG
jgi:hypothetical protein